MNPRRILPLMLVLALRAWATDPASLSQDQFASERQRIAAQRQQGTAALDAEEAACQGRFAVNDCLRPVQVRRRALLADLKRQEVRLNDLERQQRAHEQRAAVEARRQDHAAQERDSSQRQPTVPTPSEKGAARAPTEKPRSIAPDATAQAENRAAYQRKREEAERHRKDLERQRMEKPGKATTLPLPP